MKKKIDYFIVIPLIVLSLPFIIMGWLVLSGKVPSRPRVNVVAVLDGGLKVRAKVCHRPDFINPKGYAVLIDNSTVYGIVACREEKQIEEFKEKAINNYE